MEFNRGDQQKHLPKKSLKDAEAARATGNGKLSDDASETLEVKMKERRVRIEIGKISV